MSRQTNGVPDIGGVAWLLCDQLNTVHAPASNDFFVAPHA